MIKEELTERGVKHYSDKNMKIRQNETGIVYDSAEDALPCRYTYSETDEPIEDVSAEATVDDFEQAFKMIGLNK